MKHKHLIQLKIETSIPLNKLIEEFPLYLMVRGTVDAAQGQKALERVDILNVIKVAEMV